MAALDWTYGAHGAVGAVDPENGEHEVLKVASGPRP